MLNNDSLITKEDFKKGFFIVEEIFHSSAMYHQNYLIVDRENMFTGYFYRFNRETITFDLTKEKLINRHKFYDFLNKMRKCKKIELMWNPVEFIITKFTEEKIESYVFVCEGEGCKKCIDHFYDLIGK